MKKNAMMIAALIVLHAGLAACGKKAEAPPADAMANTMLSETDFASFSMWNVRKGVGSGLSSVDGSRVASAN